MIPVARPLLGEEEITAAVGVLRSGQVVQGRQVAAFEDEFSALGDVGAELGEFPGNDPPPGTARPAVRRGPAARAAVTARP